MHVGIHTSSKVENNICGWKPMPQALSLISLSNTLTIKEQSQYFIQFTQISLSLLFNTSQPHQFCSQCRNLLIPLDHLSCWWHPLFVVTAIWLLHLCWRWRRYDVDLIDSSVAVSENYEDEKATIWLLHLRWWWQYDVLVASAVTTTMVRRRFDCCISGGDNDDTTIWCAC